MKQNLASPGYKRGDVCRDWLWNTPPMSVSSGLIASNCISSVHCTVWSNVHSLTIHGPGTVPVSASYLPSCWSISQGKKKKKKKSQGRHQTSKASPTTHQLDKVKVLVTQLCLTLCNPMDCGPPVSSVHEILQARILEWVAISFSRQSSQARDQTWVSCIAGRLLTEWAIREAHFGPII